MREHRVANRYARALMDLAVEQGKAEQVEKDMRLIIETIDGSDPLKEMLQSPVISDHDKGETLKAVFGKTQALTADLFNLLANNRRADILKEIAGQYLALYDQMQGQDVAQVVTPVPLSAQLEQKILKQIKAITGRDVVVENEIDPDLIGGFVLRLGDLEYNASISSKLTNLKRELVKK